MALNSTVTPEKTQVHGNKILSLAAADVVKVLVNDVEEADLGYTVPADKTLDLEVSMSGQLETA